jgi:hypothetical protein
MIEGCLVEIARWLAMADRRLAIAARHPSRLDECPFALAGCQIDMVLFFPLVE